MGQNFHYEVSNRHLDLALSEVLRHFSSKGKGIRGDFHTSALLQSLKQVMDFKLQNNMLDFKTFISILDTDLKTSCEHDPLKVFDYPYSNFIQQNLENNELNYRELDVIQRAIHKDRDMFMNCNQTYQLSVEQSVNRVLK